MFQVAESVPAGGSAEARAPRTPGRLYPGADAMGGFGSLSVVRCWVTAAALAVAAPRGAPLCGTSLLVTAFATCWYVWPSYTFEEKDL